MRKAYIALGLIHIAALMLVSSVVLEARAHRVPVKEDFSSFVMTPATTTTNLYGPWSDRLALGTSGYIERRCAQFPSLRGNEAPFFCIWDMAHI